MGAHEEPAHEVPDSRVLLREEHAHADPAAHGEPAGTEPGAHEVPAHGEHAHADPPAHEERAHADPVALGVPAAHAELAHEVPDSRVLLRPGDRVHWRPTTLSGLGDPLIMVVMRVGHGLYEGMVRVRFPAEPDDWVTGNWELSANCTLVHRPGD